MAKRIAIRGLTRDTMYVVYRTRCRHYGWEMWYQGQMVSRGREPLWSLKIALSHDPMMQYL